MDIGVKWFAKFLERSIFGICGLFGECRRQGWRKCAINGIQASVCQRFALTVGCLDENAACLPCSGLSPFFGLDPGIWVVIGVSRDPSYPSCIPLWVWLGRFLIRPQARHSRHRAGTAECWARIELHNRVPSSERSDAVGARAEALPVKSERDRLTAGFAD
jgi:hypothetical protein